MDLELKDFTADQLEKMYTDCAFGKESPSLAVGNCPVCGSMFYLTKVKQEYCEHMKELEYSLRERLKWKENFKAILYN